MLRKRDTCKKSPLNSPAFATVGNQGSPGMWEKDDLIHPHTLLFPDLQEAEFLREHTGGKRSRVFIRNVFILFILFSLMLGIYSIFIDHEVIAIKNISYGTYATLMVSLPAAIVGVVYTVTCPEAIWVKSFQSVSVWRVPLPVFLLYLIVFVCVLRFEHFSTPVLYFYRHSSYFQTFMVVIMCLIGSATRYVSALIFFSLCGILVTLRGLSFFRFSTPITTIVHFFEYLAPSFSIVMVVWWRFAKFEKVLRLEFISYKRLQMEMARQVEQRKTLASLLDIMLPKSAIPRLISSNFMFSTVSDRFDNAFCLFIDFFKAADLKDQDFEVATTLLNETFKTFDILLRDFPEVEKIKTIGSKALLLYNPSKDETLENAGERVTLLAWETMNKMFELNAEEIESVQSALLWQLPNDYNYPKRNIRIGIALGPVVAGIVGDQGFCYDVYGDTVNVASRLQSLGLGHVLSTREVYKVLNSSKSLWIPRGLHPVKGRGELEIFELDHPIIPRSRPQQTPVDGGLPAIPSMRRRLSSTGVSRRQMTNGLADIVRRQNRQTLILSGNPVTLASAIISTEDFRTIASKDVALKSPTAMGSAVLGSPTSTHSVNSIPANAVPAVTISSVAYVTSSATATGTLQKTAEEKGGISETPIGHAMAPNTTSFSMSMPSSMSAPNFCTLPSIPSEPTPKQNPASGSNFVISSLNLPTSSYLSTPPSNPRPASNRSTPSLNTSINIDPFQPIIQKVEPLLSQGRAQELYDSIANFLIPYRLIFRDPHIELLFRSFSSSSDALSNAQHSLCGVVILWILIATAILSDAHDDSISLPPPTYIYIACGFAFAQLFIVIYQIHQSGWSPRSTLKKPQSEKTLTSYAMTPTPSTKASHLTSLGYIINLTPVFGSCITLCLFSSYGRLFDQARGSMAQNFVIYAAFIKNGAMGFVERVAVLSVLMIIILVSSAIYVEFHVYDILTTVACHCLLLVVVHRMECVMRTDFLLRETLMVSKAVSDRQTKVSTGLLNAILPQRIMKKLIQNIDLADKSVIIDFFDCISVIHTDITSFTVLSSKIQPDALIKILNTVFSSFDKICRAHGVEKILTVGDAYIAAHLGLKDVSDSYTCQIAKSLGLEWDDQVKDVVMGDSEMGLPKAAETSRGDPVFAAALSCRTALSMIAILEEMAGNTVAFAQVPGGRLLIRAGVHSGTARGFVTGGYTKIKYELFGDAVDVAEKVQELATPGMVFASKFTTDLLADQGKFDVDPVLAGMLKDGTECHHIRGLSSDDKNIGLLTSLKYM